jgi:hypothetical protein
LFGKSKKKKAGKKKVFKPKRTIVALASGIMGSTGERFAISRKPPGK